MKYDLIIIGAGPVGLAAAIHAKRKNLNYLVLEKSILVSSIYQFPTFMRFFTTAKLLEIGDHPFPSTADKPTRQMALDYYRRVTEIEDLNIKFYHKVDSISGEESNFTVSGKINDPPRISNFSFKTKYIIIATGYFDNPRKLGGIPGEDNNIISYYYKEPHSYFQRNIVVIGAGNSGAEIALELYRHGARVTLLHNHDQPRNTLKYWIGPDLKNRIKKDEIKSFMPVEITQVLDDAIEFKFNNTIKKIECDKIFAMTGFTPNIQLFKKWGLKIQSDLSIKVSEYFDTDRKGIFVIGSASSGKNTNKIFIENGREHAKIAVNRISKLT